VARGFSLVGLTSLKTPTHLAEGDRQMCRICLVVAPLVALAVSGGSVAAQSIASDRAAEVQAAERAFAKTMADRDHAAFVSFLADEAVFLGPKETLRGKAAVAKGWLRYYDGATAPFSWAPERVEVLDTGTLALSTGPVYDPQGSRGHVQFRLAARARRGVEDRAG
jgi:ketosteroid isomerase-like protein